MDNLFNPTLRDALPADTLLLVCVSHSVLVVLSPVLATYARM